MSDARNEFEAMKNGLSGLGYNKNPDDLSAYNEEEEFVPPSSIQFNTMGDGEGYNYDQKIEPTDFNDGQFLEHQHREPQNYGYEEGNRPEMPLDRYDEEIFPGGPAKSEVESWKKQYTNLYIVDDLPTDQIFIYRTLNRYEYKAITATPNTDPLMREEMICEQCVLFPYEYSYGVMANSDAGIPSILSKHIMETSGFTKASMPRRL